MKFDKGSNSKNNNIHGFHIYIFVFSFVAHYLGFNT